MKMLQKLFLFPRTVLLFLMLLSSSNSLFSGNSELLDYPHVEDRTELKETSLIGEKFDTHYLSILLYQKNLLLNVGSLYSGGEFDAHILNHTFVSQSYIKRSRDIFPSLGVKEVIFPFHVFL